MAIVPYLAITGAEMEGKGPFPFPIAWMACHFSPYSTGLSNLPRQLPKGSLLILNDRTPVCGHDPQRIAAQLEETAARLECDGILLDFQRAGESQTQAIAAAISTLGRPMAVTPAYAKGLDCAVFLPPPSLITPLERHLSAWQGREIWLEVAKEYSLFRVDAEGCRQMPWMDAPLPCPHRDSKLHCRYGIAVEDAHIDFFLHRDEELIRSLMTAAEAMGISRFVGLFQQLEESFAQ